MSSMPPSQQSIAGGIFQTVAKLCTTLGFGVATAVFSSVARKPAMASYWNETTQPYTATFFCSLACSLVGLCLVPFLTIGTQGGKEKAQSTPAGESEAGEDAQVSEQEKGESEATVAQALPTKG